MPFRTFEWIDGKLELGPDDPERVPQPLLRQVDARNFLLEQSFCYRVEVKDDPEDGTVYVIPGKGEAPDTSTRFTQTTETPPRPVVIPPTASGGLTNLASVPSFMWWLVASYGNHTRAALLHDALYVERGQQPPVSHAKADRLFLLALRESEQEKPGVFRHWLMWAAVSLFGSMGKLLGAVCALHVLAVWVLAVAGAEREWGSSIWHANDWPWWGKVLVWAAVILVGFGLFLFGLGTSWRAGVDITGGWLVPSLVLTVVLVVLLVVTKSWLVGAALVLFLPGPFWGRFVDPTLKNWIWPTSVIGLPIALIPVALIFAAVFFVLCIDWGAWLAARLRGQRREVPKVRAFRLSV